MSDDSRSAFRAKTRIEIMFKEAGSFIRVYMLNVSNGGLFIKTEDPLPLDSQVILRMKLPGDTEFMEIEGRVVWNNPKGRKNSFPKGMGIQFMNMASDNQEKISVFVEKHRQDIETHSII